MTWITSLDKGQGALQLPNELTAEDLDDLEAWFVLILKIHRARMAREEQRKREALSA